MLRRARLFITTATTGTYIIFTSSNHGECQTSTSNKPEISFEVAKKMKSGIQFINNDSNKPIREYKETGIKIWAPSSPISGSNIFRVGTAEIRVGTAEILEILNDGDSRMLWDKKMCSKSTIIKQSIPGINKSRKEDESKLLYFSSNKRYLIPSRDFSIRCFPSTGAAALGINSYTAIAVINVDANAEVPKSWKEVRGQMNSVWLLEPLTLNKTKVTYLVDVDPKGWFWIPPFQLISQYAAGDNIVSTLQSLKEVIEENRSLNDSTSKYSVDDAAKLIFQKKILKQNAVNSSSILSDVTVEIKKDDLIATIKILEERLKSISNSERKDGIDLSDLKKRVKDDLQKAKDRLRSM